MAKPTATVADTTKPEEIAALVEAEPARPPAPELPALPDLKPGTELSKVLLQEPLPAAINNGSVRQIQIGEAEYRPPGSPRGHTFIAQKMIFRGPTVAVLSDGWPECQQHVSASGARRDPSPPRWKEIPVSRIATMDVWAKPAPKKAEA